MAEVFRATGVGPDGFERPFVIKRIHPRLSEAPEFVRMFVHEAKISARLIHPNIVQVFELAYQDGAHYMVMEPVEGMDMGWLLKRRRERPHESLSPAFVAEVGRQVCRGPGIRPHADHRRGRAAAHRPPRRDPAQHHGGVERDGEGPGLRHRARRRGNPAEPDRPRHGEGEDVVRGARAAGRQDGRRPVGPVLAGRRSCTSCSPGGSCSPVRTTWRR